VANSGFQRGTGGGGGGLRGEGSGALGNKVLRGSWVEEKRIARQEVEQITMEQTRK